MITLEIMLCYVLFNCSSQWTVLIINLTYINSKVFFVVSRVTLAVLKTWPIAVKAGDWESESLVLVPSLQRWVG